MAEHSANALQNILPNAAAIFTESPVPCNRGLIFHRDGSGIFRLASPSRIANGLSSWNRCCPCCRRMPEALYQVHFHSNIAIPIGGTVDAISVGIAIDGAVDPSSTMIFTPAAVEQFGNIGAEIVVAVPAICGCETVSVVNTSTQAIDMQNANIDITYVGIR